MRWSVEIMKCEKHRVEIEAPTAAEAVLIAENEHPGWDGSLHNIKVVNDDPNTVPDIRDDAPRCPDCEHRALPGEEYCAYHLGVERDDDGSPV